MTVEDYDSDVRVTYALARSREWVDSLDRSALGRFAVDAELLTVVHAYIVDSLSDDWGSESALCSELKPGIDTAIRSGKFNSLGFGVPFFAEAVFWMSRADNGAEFVSSYVSSSVLSSSKDDLMRAVSMFSRMTAAPYRTVFYEVGVWDDVVIDRAVADGVDPALLHSMVG